MSIKKCVIRLPIVILIVLANSANSLSGSASSTSSTNTSPNILLILVDDLGYGDLSVAPFTGHGTNNLERMARESTAMSKFPRCCFDLYSEPCVDSDWFVSLAFGHLQYLRNGPSSRRALGSDTQRAHGFFECRLLHCPCEQVALAEQSY